MPPPARRGDGRPGRPEWRRFLLWLGLALALAGAAGLLVEREREPPVLDSHRAFAASFRAEGAMLDPAERAGLPDLSAAGLSLARSHRVAGGLYAGYRGSGGCRLGLWLGPRAGLPSRPLPEARLALVPRGAEMLWLAAGTEVDPRRFGRLAAALQQGGLPADPLCPE
jgi:hypothetical protein